MDPDSINQKSFWLSSQSFFFENGSASSLDGVPVPSIAFASSGSTGEPCRYVLSKESLLLSARVVNEHLQVDTASRWGLCLPWWHVGGFSVSARAFAAACGLEVFREKWKAAIFLDWLKWKKITHLSLVPTQVFDLVAINASAPAGLIAVVVGGGRLDRRLGQQARDLGWPVLASYGMTEAGSQIATASLQSLNQPYTCDDLSILSYWQVRAADSAVLQIKGPLLFQGTLREDHGNWRYVARNGDWYQTRDCGEISGALLRGIARSDDLVKVLGELVSPAQIESQLADLGMPVGKFTVLTIPDSRKGHRLVLVIENNCNPSSMAILAAYNATVPGFARLDEPRFIDSFPRSDLGKILRRELSALL
jgi:O-succinylbenzoic acid--CoA ligase